ncbi:MAG: outer membrane protein assembly factor BamE [Geminicoccaceae bacterium]|nr:MAG: outer membrane protein assembly factor BamE [Geminicoccaceae bacterium]
MAVVAASFRSRLYRVVGVAALAVLLAACNTTVINHGHRLIEDDVNRIRPGMSTKAEVVNLLGSPSALASFDDDTWYYVGRRVEEETFFNRRLASQDVVRVRFDERGIVAGVDRFDLADAREVTPERDITPTGGNEMTIVEQFITNIGRFGGDTGPASPRF